MERKYEVGQDVVYVDGTARRHQALITAWWRAQGREPSANLVFVSGDPAKEDTFGRQIERETSVPHRSHQVAPGKFWCWPDEL